MKKKGKKNTTTDHTKVDQLIQIQGKKKKTKLPSDDMSSSMRSATPLKTEIQFVSEKNTKEKKT